MKRVIVGILLGMTILCQPITAHAQCEIYPRTHEVKMNVNEFTYEEARMLLEIAQAEAGNQGADGMWLVMSVVYNRRDSEEFPDSIKEVIFQDSQFYTKGMGATEISPECHEALARIEKGEVAPEIIAFEKSTSNRLDHFFSSAFGYRDHNFYTLKK
jgi:N-acetylmuramoyl-L-alanine amidase